MTSDKLVIYQRWLEVHILSSIPLEDMRSTFHYTSYFATLFPFLRLSHSCSINTLDIPGTFCLRTLNYFSLPRSCMMYVPTSFKDFIKGQTLQISLSLSIYLKLFSFSVFPNLIAQFMIFLCAYYSLTQYAYYFTQLFCLWNASSVCSNFYLVTYCCIHSIYNSARYNRSLKYFLK